MKKKIPVLVVCILVAIGVAICLSLDNLSLSPEVGSIEKMSVMIENGSTVTIDSSNILDDFKAAAKSLKKIKKDEGYNIDNFLMLTYGSGSQDKIFLSSEYLIMNNSMYTGNKIKSLYSMVWEYASKNRDISSFLDGISFSISPMDVPYVKEAPAPAEIINAICHGSIDNTFVKIHDSSDMLSNVYCAQEFPAYKLTGTSSDENRMVNIYIINSHLAYVDIYNSRSFFVRVNEDLYSTTDRDGLLKSIEPSEIYYLFNASSIEYDGKKAGNTVSSVRALCGLYAMDSEDVDEDISIPVTALIGSKKFNLKVYKDYISFNGMTFSAKGAASAFLRSIRED